MKSTIIFISLLISSIVNAQINESKLTIDIRGKDCNGGFSFCTIEANSNETSLTQKFLLQKISETELQFIIIIKELTNEEQKVIFGKEIYEISKEDRFNFNQDYDFQLDADCIKALELKSKNSTIKNGKYPITLTNDKAIIILKLINTL